MVASHANPTTPYLTPVGPYIAFVWESLPLPVLVLSAGLAQVSDHAIEAARDLGAAEWQVLLHVSAPIAMVSVPRSEWTTVAF